jgi:1,2-diacylglycerol 3-beta-glucosyltransferase
MMFILGALLWACGLYLTAYVAYQLLLYIANAVVADPPEFTPSRHRHITVVIPAHDEELLLPRLLTSLETQVYPRDRYRVTVIADNCEDGTVAAAGPFTADVLERRDAARRSKGHAIGWVLGKLDLPRTDAIVIVDGDSLVGADFVSQLNLQLERGDRVIQCYNGLANPKQTWFTRVMDVSRTIANEILHPGKRKLGLSSHLMGNGMCFATDALTAHGWQAFSAGEDWEHYAQLILSGEEVGYCRLAHVYHQESTNLSQASSQRLRWSSSRFRVLRTYGVALLVHGVRSRSVKCIDASLPLVFPNPSLGMNMTGVGLVLAAAYWTSTGAAGFLWWYFTLTFLQFLMFLIGVLYTRDRLANAISIVVAPVFLGWKMGIDILSMAGRATREFKRTERKPL